MGCWSTLAAAVQTRGRGTRTCDSGRIPLKLVHRPPFFLVLHVKQYKMTQFDLFVATRASHAALLPVVLIASFINEARPLVATLGTFL